MFLFDTINSPQNGNPFKKCSYLYAPTHNFSVFADWRLATQENQTRHFRGMGKNVRKSWVLGGVYFLDGGHDGDSDKMSEQGRLSIEICLQRTGRTEENLAGKCLFCANLRYKQIICCNVLSTSCRSYGIPPFGKVEVDLCNIMILPGLSRTCFEQGTCKND